MTQVLSLVLVDRSPNRRQQLRQALEAVPGVQIAGERGDLRSGLALAHQVRPAVLMLELAEPIEDALAAAAEFRLESPDTAILFTGEAYDQDLLLQAMRAGASDIIKWPLDRAALGQALERIAALQLRKQGGAVQRRVITVFSNKGGSGVSTIATNLAVSLRRRTQREVALVDFDYQSGDVAFFLRIDPKRSLGDIVAAPRVESAIVQDTLTKHESGVYVLPQPEQLDRVEGITAEHVGPVLDILAKTFDIVVVDAPHVFNEVSLEIFDRTSTIILLAELSVPSIRAARRSLEIFDKLNFLAVPDRVRVVVNRYSDQGAVTIGQLEETLGLPVFASVANDFFAVSEAINLGRPLCGEKAEGRAARDIVAFAHKLVPGETADGQPETVPPRRPGRLRLFGRG
jgi:pilus assembly protein CpaE